MRSRELWTGALALMLALTFSADPALAQGKAKGHDKDKANPTAARVQERVERDRPELIRRDRDDRHDDGREDARRQDRRQDDRYEVRDSRKGSRTVPPGWCIGRGNPHNTPENCGYRSDRRFDDRIYRDGRSDRGLTFEEAHARFHRDQEQRCERVAAERPLDIAWQIRVRAECRDEHDRWHDRHDPERRDRR